MGAAMTVMDPAKVKYGGEHQFLKALFFVHFLINDGFKHMFLIGERGENSSGSCTNALTQIAQVGLHSTEL